MTKTIFESIHGMGIDSKYDGRKNLTQGSLISIFLEL